MARDLSRLRELVEVVLPATPDDEFNLQRWRHHFKFECKTVFCACGWAAQQKLFREAGLRLIEEEDGAQLVYETEEVEETGYEAAATFFNIDMSDALHLFCPGQYETDRKTTKQQVIDRISQYLKENSNA